MSGDSSFSRLHNFGTPESMEVDTCKLDLEKGVDGSQSESTSVSNSSKKNYSQRNLIFDALILAVGAIASGAFLALGVTNAKSEQDVLFDSLATEFAKAIEDAWNDYELYGLWLHESCRSRGKRDDPTPTESNLGICSREEFNELYQYVLSNGLNFQSAQIMVNATNDRREGLEYEAQEYYSAHYPHVNYRGITGLFPTQEGGLTIKEQSNQSFYFPVHYVEPVVGNENAIELDIFSSPTQKHTIEHVTSSWTPGMTDRLKLVQETDPSAYSVILHHPGIRLASQIKAKPTEISLMVIRMPDLIARAAERGIFSEKSLSTYIFDIQDQSKPPVFLGAASFQTDNLSSLPEKKLSALPVLNVRHTERVINVADRQWIVVTENVPGTFEADVVYVVVGGCIIALASLVLAIWFHSHMSRIAKINTIKRTAEQEKAAIFVETARKQAAAERELNEFIAHEVRNPLASAIAALSFVSSKACDPSLVQNPQSRQMIKSDIDVIDSSLQFINELLRNMLDLQRSSDKASMKINVTNIDIMKDIFEPVAAILFMRGAKVNVISECPKNIIIQTDRMRLKQIFLNLATNATKFVGSGYIKLRAEVKEGKVWMYCEDSGPGIPESKRGMLFSKFQESLGIGLAVCKNLSKLLDADLYLDETFESGVPGCPGTRFTLQFHQELLQLETPAATTGDSKHVEAEKDQETNNELPDHIRVLFVDDDMVIRKMFSRTLRNVAPTWTVQEASNGETALCRVDECEYDIIFMDQYMASVEKQLLGTEAVRLMRSKGVRSVICGLSANDKEQEFYEAGASDFWVKPFPCQKIVLKRELLKLLSLSQHVVAKEPIDGEIPERLSALEFLKVNTSDKQTSTSIRSLSTTAA